MSGQNHTVRFGPFELDIQIGELRKNNTRLKLQGQPIQILEMVLAKPGELVTREEIQQRLWPADTFVDFDHSVNTAVKKLRQALGDEADAPCYIETVPKRGYRFIGQVEREVPDPLDDKVVSPVPTPRSTHRLPWNWVLTGCSVALLTAGGVVYRVSTPPSLPRIARSHVVARNAYTSMGALPERTLLTDGKSIYFQRRRPAGIATFQAPVTGGEESEISAVPGFLSDISRDGSELLFLVPIDAEETRFNLWTQPLPAGSPRLIVKETSDEAVWTSDGAGIFFTRQNDSELYRANADGSGERRLASSHFYGLSLSPDGSRIRFGLSQGSTPNFRMWELGADGSNPHQVLERDNIFRGAWSADGSVYFFSAWDGDRYDLWAVRDEESRWRRGMTVPRQLTFGPMSFGPPVTSRNGSQLYAEGEEHQGELSVYDRPSGKFVPYLGGISVCYVDFSRDGQWMAYVSYPEGSLWRSKIDGTQKMRLTSPPMGVMNPRWSPDGKMIVFTDASGGGKGQGAEAAQARIYIVNAEGGSPELLLAGEVFDPTWSANGDLVAYASGEDHSALRILNLQTQKSTEVPISHGLWSPRWSPDGKYLVALVDDPSTKMALFTFATNQWQILASGADFGWESWSRDSKFVYAQEGPSLIRIEVASHKRQQIASVAAFKSVAYRLDEWSGGWFGLSPDNEPITTRDTGIEGIYALDLEYK